MSPVLDDFRNQLRSVFESAEAVGLPYIYLDCEQLQEMTDGRTAAGPGCCSVMLDEMEPGDRIIEPSAEEPGRLTICYLLPRRRLRATKKAAMGP